MQPLSVVLIGFVVLAAVFSIVWLVQCRTQNAGMVDPVWSFSLGFLAVLYAFLGDGDGTARILVGILGGLWGARLGSHLWMRNHGKPEDGRYHRFRDEWGANANRNMFWFFQFQVVLALLLSLGFLVVAYRPAALSAGPIVLALVVWIASVLGEALADWQLEKFKKDPANRGQVCSVGLWHYSRHPNYFFECLHWLAYIFLAWGSPWIWATLIPPAVMWFLLLKISGIPMTEQQTAKSRPGYAHYIETTSAFFPWPPKSDRASRSTHI